MALLRRDGDRRLPKRRRAGVSPVIAGLIALALIVLVTGFIFTKFNPFADPYEFRAMFASANNLKAKSPVRIAGVTVGEVIEVKPVAGGTGAALVKMKMTEAGLPIHRDAELKVRPRIFLEGNFFVDLQPGSPSEPALEKGETIPITQTAAPVQFSQLLTALQADTREDLRTFLAEYSLKALKGEGAAGFNRSIQYWEDAYRNTALANTALLGTDHGDLSNVVRGQAEVAAALARHPEQLKDFVTDFNTTAAAFAREDDDLQAAIPALRDVLRTGEPALASLNDALPSLRGFARDALPGVRSSPETLDASIPLVRQLRGLVGERELKGLTHDLRRTIPSLARLNRSQIPFLRQNRQLSSCQNQVILPFAESRIPNGDDFPDPDSTNQRVVDQVNRSFVGLAGESRLSDGNGQMIRAQVGSGATTIVRTNLDFGPAAGGAVPLLTQTPFGNNFERVRPAPPPVTGSGRTAEYKRPDFRPSVRCETQQAPNLNGPLGTNTGGTGEEFITIPNPLGSPEEILRQLPVTLPAQSRAQAERNTERLTDLLSETLDGAALPLKELPNVLSDRLPGGAPQLPFGLDPDSRPEREDSPPGPAAPAPLPPAPQSAPGPRAPSVPEVDPGGLAPTELLP